MIQFLRKLLRQTDGATAIEYGLILALVCIACLGAVGAVADKTIGMWNGVAQNVLAH
ncbi:Flp family type IVb pilin [Sphingomonas sp.]|uniref:Flp family type IVb pilin n=1 Tax=Sphingomonas sp. TaxID=28214 RepID=UPI0039C93751